MRDNMALQTTASTWWDAARLQPSTYLQRGTPRAKRVVCPRTLLPHDGQKRTLERSYGVCPSCASGRVPPR
jgi:hypothetical protein